MKNAFSLVLTLFFAALVFVSCGNDSAGNQQNTPETANTPTLQQPAPIEAPTAAPTQTSGVLHYTCPNNCAGSGGDMQGNCPVCGTAYVHNQAYHNTPAQTTNTTTTTTPPATNNPAQNAAGVWHYTCSNGCAGGSGTAGTCATCGGALAHNQAYHQ